MRWPWTVALERLTDTVLYAGDSEQSLPVDHHMSTSDFEPQRSELPEVSSGRQGRIVASRGNRGRRVAAGVLIVLLLAVISVTSGLFDVDDEAVRAEARRRIESALELQGVKLKPVRSHELAAETPVGSEATLVRLADEHLKNGRVVTTLLEQLSGLGPLVVNLAQTSVSSDGIEPIVSRPDVLGLILLGTGIDDESLSSLRGRFQLRTLSLERTAVSDQGLSHLSRLTGLRQLYLTGTRITDEGLARLADLTRLESVKLGDTEIGDAGLVSLARLPRLKFLSLDRTRVTDAGVPVLAEIQSLEFLDLHSTWVTDEGIKRLRDALPGCRVEH